MLTWSQPPLNRYRWLRWILRRQRPPRAPVVGEAYVLHSRHLYQGHALLVGTVAREGGGRLAWNGRGYQVLALDHNSAAHAGQDHGKCMLKDFGIYHAFWLMDHFGGIEDAGWRLVRQLGTHRTEEVVTQSKYLSYVGRSRRIVQMLVC